VNDRVTFYVLEKRTIETAGMIATAAVWSCVLCKQPIDGMGGPGDGELCERCGDDIKAGKFLLMR